MRPAGPSSPEQMRTPASGGRTRRAASASTPEVVRSAGTTQAEGMRAAEQTTSELVFTGYIREHPPVAGCSIFSIQGVAGLGTAGCMVAGLELGYRP